MWRCLQNDELGIGHHPGQHGDRTVLEGRIIKSYRRLLGRWAVREEMRVSLSLVEVAEQTRSRVALVIDSKPLSREEEVEAAVGKTPHEGSGRAR